MAIQTVLTLEDVRRQRKQILALSRQYRTRQVYVFGLLLHGKLHESSDIDFLVEFEEDNKLRDHIRLTQGLQQPLSRRVEMVDRCALRENYGRSSSKKSKPCDKDQRVYCRDILDRIRHIANYTAAGRDAFFESKLLLYEVNRSFQVIGERGQVVGLYANREVATSHL